MTKGYRPALNLAFIGVLMFCIGVFAGAGWKWGLVIVGILAFCFGSIAWAESKKDQ